MGVFVNKINNVEVFMKTVDGIELNPHMIEVCSAYLKDKSILDASASVYLNELAWRAPEGANQGDIRRALESLRWPVTITKKTKHRNPRVLGIRFR